VLLEVRDLQVSYGKVRAVQGLSLHVGEDEIVALIGANGAGKSSTMNALCGIVRAATGEVRFAGRRIDGLPAHRIVRQGIVQVPEGRMIFSGLTIRENLLLGAYAARDRGTVQADIARVLELFPALRLRLGARASDLSGGQQQMLALARGMMAAPRLLLLDEPSLGLAPVAVKEVFALIADLRRRGITILLVEQNVRQALAIADRGYVMEGGRLILDGAAGDLLEHELLVSSYLGIKRDDARTGGGA